MPTTRICDVEPFRYQATPQPIGDQGASSNQINEQSLEDYLNRMREAICSDIESIIAECCGDVFQTSFLELTDTPDTYAGAGTFHVVVNALETGLEFQALPTPTPDRPDLSTRLVSLIKPNNGTVVGVGSLSLLGNVQVVVGGSTASHPVPTGADPLNSVWRYQINSAAIAGGVGSIRHSVGLVLGAGGWRFVGRWGTGTALAAQRFFIGVINTTGAIANVNPSTLLNLVGVSYDSGETNLFVIHNDGAGAATRVDLGAGFPVDTSSFFECEFVMEPGSGVVTYRVLNVGTGAEATGTINTDLPADATLLNDYIWANSGATIAIVRADMQCLYLETSQ